jgi:hypothetical protein
MMTVDRPGSIVAEKISARASPGIAIFISAMRTMIISTIPSK